MLPQNILKSFLFAGLQALAVTNKIYIERRRLQALHAYRFSAMLMFNVNLLQESTSTMLTLTIA